MPENDPSSPLPDQMNARWYNTERFDPNDKWAGFDPASTAIVLVDLVNWQAHPDGANIRALRDAGQVEAVDYLVERCTTVLVPALSRALDAARRSGIRVVHARLASRSADYLDVVPAFQPYLRGAEAQEGSWGCQVLDGLEEPGDFSVVKSGSGAFNSSDLDGVLRNSGVRTVLYAGVVTSACVLLTVAAGFDLGYRQYLLTDCTAALNDSDQAAAEMFMGTYMAQLTTSDEFIGACSGRRHLLATAHSD
jgi:nicotinamidase-related amidase